MGSRGPRRELEDLEAALEPFPESAADLDADARPEKDRRLPSSIPHHFVLIAPRLGSMES